MSAYDVIVPLTLIAQATSSVRLGTACAIKRMGGLA